MQETHRRDSLLSKVTVIVFVFFACLVTQYFLFPRNIYDFQYVQEQMRKDGITPPVRTMISNARHREYRPGYVWQFSLDGKESLQHFLLLNPDIGRGLRDWDATSSRLALVVSGYRSIPKQYARIPAKPPRAPFTLDVAISELDDSVYVFIGVEKSRH